ncbi:MAG TPA: YfhO family protein [Thermoleophilaceae bacterium]
MSIARLEASSSRRGWGDAAALAVFAVAVAWLFSASLFGGRVLTPADLSLFGAPWAGHLDPAASPAAGYFGDPVHFVQPDLYAARTQIRGGHVPAWNPAISGGRPLLASQQAAPLYPVNGLAHVFPFWQSLAWIAALKVLLAAVGAYLLCRAYALSRWAATLGGLAFGMGHGFVLWLEHPHAAVWALLPWALLTGERLVVRARAADAALLGIVTGCALLGGHPESFFVLLLALVGYLAVRIRQLARRRGMIVRRRLALAFAALFLAWLIGGVATLPFLEALVQSDDVRRPQFSDPLRILYGAFFPDKWGRPDRGVDHGGPGVGYSARALYVGALPLVLAFAGALRRLPPERRDVKRFFVGLTVCALLLTVDLPPQDLIVHVPPFSLMIMHWFVWPAFLGIAVLAAFGLDGMLAADGRDRRRLLVAAGAAAVVPVLWELRHPSLLGHLGDAIGQLPDLDESRPSFAVTSATAALRWTVLACGGGVVAWLLSRKRGRALGAALVIALTVADLVLVSRGYHPAIPERSAAPPDPSTLRFVKERVGSARVGGVANAFSPNVAAFHGLRDLRGEGLPRLRRHSQLYEALDGTTNRSVGRNLYEPRSDRAVRLLDVFAVRYVFEAEPTLPARPGFHTIADARGDRLVENRSAVPRAWVAHDWRVAKDFDDALDTTAGSTTAELRRAPVIEGSARPRRDSGIGRGAPPSTARIRRDEPSEVRIEYTSPASGWLVLADTHYPGWKAEVDGQRASIHPANAAFRAVAAPAGRHTVTFRYRSASVTAGVAMTVAGILTAALLLAVPRARRQASERVEPTTRAGAPTATE